jgi:predicted PurR-regulated permease PerM
VAEQHSSLKKTHFPVIVTALAIIMWRINQAQSFLVLVLVSVFLAVAGAPPVFWLERKCYMVKRTTRTSFTLSI